MGAMFFALLMGAMFFTGLFLAVVNIVLIIVWNIRRGHGKSPKKRWLAVHIVVLVFGAALMIIPVGWVVFLRYGNGSATGDTVIAQSGEVAYWGEDENGGAWSDSFIWNGVEYVLYQGGSVDTWTLGDAAVNVKYDNPAFTKFMNALFNYDDTCTLYPVKNGGGFDLYTIKDMYGNMYCPQDQTDAVAAYYSDIERFDLEQCVLDCAIENDDPQYYTLPLSLSGDEFLRFADGMAAEDENGTPLYSTAEELQLPRPDEYIECSLYVYSRDGAVRRDGGWFGVLDGRGYWLDNIAYDDGGGGATIYARPLPDDLNALLLEAVNG